MDDGEQLFRSLSKVAPSSAGFYYDEAGTLVVRIRDAADRSASLRFIQALVRENPGYNPGGGRSAAGFRVEPAEFTFDELAQARRIASTELLGRTRGVVTVDLDERNNRVSLGIEGTSEPSSAKRAELTSALRAAGVDERMLLFRSAAIATAGLDYAPPYTLQSNTTDPLAGGQQIVKSGTLDGCSVGFVAQRSGVLGFVTASHCSSDMYMLDFTQWTILPLSAQIIAGETVDAPFYLCSVLNYRCRGADALFAASSGQISMTVGKILRTQSLGTGTLIVSTSKPYFTAIYSQDDVIAGQQVDMIGRTSGWTTGSVVSTCIDQLMLRGSTLYQIRCAAQGGYNADGGDSGAPVFVRTPGHPEIQGSELPGAPFYTDEFVSLVGIHSGHAFGMRFFSKLGRIKSDLGGSWNVTAPIPAPPPAPLSAYITGATDVLTSPSCNLRYVANATGGVWNTYSYDFSTSGTIKYQSGRELIVAFVTAGTHHVTVNVSDADGSTLTSVLSIYASANGMDCQTI